MKILQLCNRVPFPPVDGGSIAMNNLGLSLQENGATVKILAFNTIKQFADIEKLDEDYKKRFSLETVYLDNRIKILPAFLNLFSDKSYHIQRFISNEFENALERILKGEKFDVVQMEGIFMMPYYDVIRRNSKAVISLRTHNVEYQIWERIAKESSNPFKKSYINLLAKRLKKFEEKAFKKADMILALSKEDEIIIRTVDSQKTIYIVPVGLNIDDYKFQKQPEQFSIFHIGAMDWIPNQEGIKWFIENVWTQLKKEFPKLKFRIAGKNMPPDFFKYKSLGVEVFSFVEDAKQFMAEGSIMVVPLFSGSGIRVKIIEGMALGKTIITTSIGLEGIFAETGKEVIIADTAPDFINSIRDLISHQNRLMEIGEKAHIFARNNFDNDEIARRLIKFYEEG